jgi:hypothetical protein
VATLPLALTFPATVTLMTPWRDDTLLPARWDDPAEEACPVVASKLEPRWQATSVLSEFFDSEALGTS